MTECKDRWKNLRGSYSKYKAKLKTKSGQGAKRVKEYYLAPHLLFLDPFLKSRKSRGNMDEESDTLSDGVEAGTSEHEANSDSAEVLSLDNNSILSMASSHSPLPSPSTSNYTQPLSIKIPATPIPKRDVFRKRKKLPVSATSINEVNNQAYQYFEKKQHMLESQNTTKKTNTTIEPLDPDLAFLHSVLPDMKSMNSTQKRHFKLGILNLSEQILSCTTSAFPAPPTNVPQSCSQDSVNANLNSPSQGNNLSERPSFWSTHSMDRNLNSTSQGNTEVSTEPYNMNEFIQYNNLYFRNNTISIYFLFCIKLK